jgi:steroid delta-isomerase-like uncharacterized protein
MWERLMTLVGNKEIASQFYEALNSRETAKLEALLWDDFVDHPTAGDEAVGVASFMEFLGMVMGIFPDLGLHVEDLFAEGSKVAARLLIHGTQEGVFPKDIEPTGKHVSWTGIDILEIRAGKIVARWSERDLLGLVNQLREG